MIKFIMNNKNDNNTDRGIEEKKGEHGSFNTFALILQAYFFYFSFNFRMSQACILN